MFILALFILDFNQYETFEDIKDIKQNKSKIIKERDEMR